MSKINRSLYLYLIWAIALTGTIGSLIMSEILGWVPCVLCWYQRIALYPLVVIVAVGILKKDHHLPYYILPLAFGGMVIAFYQWLLQIGVLQEIASPCLFGVSCKTTYFNYFGFVNIAFLSLLAFSMIISLTLLYIKGGKKI